MKSTLITIAGLAFACAAIAAQVDPSRPMVTGRGNVSGGPGKSIVTNQTTATSQTGTTVQAPASPDDGTLRLEKFVVTGTLIQRPSKAPKSK